MPLLRRPFQYGRGLVAATGLVTPYRWTLTGWLFALRAIVAGVTTGYFVIASVVIIIPCVAGLLEIRLVLVSLALLSGAISRAGSLYIRKFVLAKKMR